MITLLRKLASGFALLLALAASPCVAQTQKPPPLTILVSIDGFRADYLQRGKTPTLSLMQASDGVSCGDATVVP